MLPKALLHESGYIIPVAGVVPIILEDLFENRRTQSARESRQFERPQSGRNCKNI